MESDVKHECVSEHCVTCCPSARAYSEGVQVGKDLYSRDAVGDPLVPLVIGGVSLLGAVIAAGIARSVVEKRTS